MSEAAYRMDGQRVPAADFYACACSPQRSVVIEACAGAGKTWMLVSRILRALLTGTEPQHILAVTFTRKAAGEMRTRLEEWLRDFSEARSSHETRVQALCERGLALAEAQQQAPLLGTLQERLLRGGQTVEVRTFHGWFVQLLGHAPLHVVQALRLPTRYELIEDTAVLRAPLFKRFHARVQANAALRADYLGLVGRHRRHAVLQWLEAAWSRAPELARADAAGSAENAVPSASQLWAACADLQHPDEQLRQPPLHDLLQALAREMGRSKNLTPQKAAQALVDASLGDPADHFDAAWAALFTQAGTVQVRLGESALLGMAAEALQTLRQQRLQQAAHVDHAAMLRLSRVLLVEYAALKRERGLVDMADLERTAEALLGDSEVAGWVQQRLDQQVRQVLIDEFQDTSPLQWQALQAWLSSYAGSAEGPRVFIVGDPKQSIYRFRGAEPKVFEAAQDFVVQGLGGVLLACNHTRRNATAVMAAVNDVFTSAANEDGWGPFTEHTTGATTSGRVLRLRGALRSDLPDKASARGGNPVWRDSLTEPKLESESRLRTLEAAQAAQAVADWVFKQGLACGDVMLLARKRSMLAHAAQALADLGVPHVVAEPLALHRSPEALDLMAVLDVLASPGHDLALARALRSPLFGASDADLLGLARRVVRSPLSAVAANSGAFDHPVSAASVAPAPAPASWLEALLGAFPADSAGPGSLSPALARASRLFRTWASLASTLTPHELLDRVVADAEAVQRFAAAVPASRRVGALHGINALLAATLEHGGARFSTLYGLVRDFRAGRLNAHAAAPQDAVQLLTVHGAKGLEARAVLVMDCDPAPRSSHQPQLLVDWPAIEPAPRRVAFVRSDAAVPLSLQATWDLELAAQGREELNSLYVAMTRAREQLVFSRTEPHVASKYGRSWWQRCGEPAALWKLPPAEPAATPIDRAAGTAKTMATGPDPALPAASAREPATEAQATPAIKVPALPRLQVLSAPLDMAVLRPRRAVADNPAVARLGQAVHRVLEWAGQPGRNLPAVAWPQACVAAAMEFGLGADAASRVLTPVQAVLSSAACRLFFSGPQLQWAGSEVPVAAAGKPVRLDRLVALRADDGSTDWWVLDYKLHHEPAEVLAYCEQLHVYVQAVQVLQPGARVYGAFITGRGHRVDLPAA
jgi:ATP-dependent helicase/nuclease subunit A